MKKLVLLAALSLASICAIGASTSAAQEDRVLHLPMRAGGPGSLDPVVGSTVYDNRAASMIYETLLQYKYLKRPLELEPLLLSEMPEMIEKDGEVRFRFKLRKGVMFQDDACFAGGKGRELVTDDVFYSFKRLADKRYTYKSFWIVDGIIKGFNEWKDEQAANFDSGAGTNYDAPVEGFVKIDDHTFEIVLEKPIYAFLFKLAQFQLSIVPREAVEKYGDEFARHPVGTGPFVLEEWIDKKNMTVVKSPSFRGETYPTEYMPEDVELGLHEAAGKSLPFVDRIETTFFVNENPMWLEFKSGKLDYTQVPAENYLEAFHKRSRKLKKEFREQGIVAHNTPLLDFIFRGFNMVDDVVGGDSERALKLRRAISLAIDLEEFDDSFYNDTNILYDGVIPPGLDGYPKDGRASVSYMGPDLARARQLLAEAGYPGGEGLDPISYYTSAGGNSREQAEMMKRQLAEIGVELNVRLLVFAQLIDAIDQKKAQMFSFAWSSDYPDGENNLAMFYGPNKSPGSNHFNYENDRFDELYRTIQLMEPSPERTKLYEEMQLILLNDVPYVGSMARTRFYVVNPWLRNFKPTEDFYNWMKYLDVDEGKRNL